MCYILFIYSFKQGNIISFSDVSLKIIWIRSTYTYSKHIVYGEKQNKYINLDEIKMYKFAMFRTGICQVIITGISLFDSERTMLARNFRNHKTILSAATFIHQTILRNAKQDYNRDENIYLYKLIYGKQNTPTDAISQMTNTRVTHSSAIDEKKSSRYSRYVNNTIEASTRDQQNFPRG